MKKTYEINFKLEADVSEEGMSIIKRLGANTEVMTALSMGVVEAITSLREIKDVTVGDATLICLKQAAAALSDPDTAPHMMAVLVHSFQQMIKATIREAQTQALSKEIDHLLGLLGAQGREN